MDAISTLAAQALFAKEDRFQRLQLEFIDEFRKARRPTSILVVDPQEFTFWIHPREKAELLAVYFEPFDDGNSMLHIVFNDEFFPIRRIDEAYRNIRKERYGRITDIETIGVEFGVVVYNLTFASIQPYETSIHRSQIVRSKNVHVATWNHMFHPLPAGWQRYTAVAPEMLVGTREDAERHASQA